MDKFPATMQTLYREVDVMKRCLAEGYATVAFGSGPWVDQPPNSGIMKSQRLVRVAVLRHPDGSIIAREIWKADDGVTKVHAPAQEVTHNESSLSELLRTWKVRITDPVPLAEVIAKVEQLERLEAAQE